DNNNNPHIITSTDGNIKNVTCDSSNSNTNTTDTVAPDNKNINIHREKKSHSLLPNTCSNHTHKIASAYHNKICKHAATTTPETTYAFVCKSGSEKRLNTNSTTYTFVCKSSLENRLCTAKNCRCIFQITLYLFEKSNIRHVF
ncbi:hypothetical protein Ahia01_001215800, partial [Argonauta hians]